MRIPAIGDEIYASAVFPGMILDTGHDDGGYPVVEIVVGYDTITFHDGIAGGQPFEVGYADLVTVVGYFNP